VTVVRVAAEERSPEALAGAEGLTVVVMASVRAWKGASGVSPRLAAVLADVRARAEALGTPLQVVWLAPRALGEGVHLPGGGPDVEEALAERLFGPGQR
jgi:hypothetical protein